MKHTKEFKEKLSKMKQGEGNPTYIKGLDGYRTYEWLYQKYVVEEKSLKDISNIAGVSDGAIYKWLDKVGIKKRGKGSLSGNKHPMWKGGRNKTSQGYIHIYYKGCHLHKNNRLCVPEQILVSEKVLKRRLNKDETIHHINEIKDDNSPNNLYLFSSESEHQRYHAFLRFGKTSRITQSNLIVK